MSAWLAVASKTTARQGGSRWGFPGERTHPAIACSVYALPVWVLSWTLQRAEPVTVGDSLTRQPDRFIYRRSL